jgi:hypothetical protein
VWTVRHPDVGLPFDRAICLPITLASSLRAHLAALVGAIVARFQEIPVWMLDTAACCWTVLAAEPTVTLAALCERRVNTPHMCRLNFPQVS